MEIDENCSFMLINLLEVVLPMIPQGCEEPINELMGQVREGWCDEALLCLVLSFLKKLLDTEDAIFQASKRTTDLDKKEQSISDLIEILSTLLISEHNSLQNSIRR